MKKADYTTQALKNTSKLQRKYHEPNVGLCPIKMLQVLIYMCADQLDAKIYRLNMFPNLLENDNKTMSQQVVIQLSLLSFT